MMKKFGRVTVVGPTNAGKSTLLNTLVGVPLASISHKVQTTDRCISGISTYGDTQIAFLDTPGFFIPRGRTQGNAHLMRHIRYGTAQAHVVFVLVDAQRPLYEEFLNFLASLKVDAPLFLLLNKVDLVKDKQELLPLIEAYNAVAAFEQTFLISALKLKGLDALYEALCSKMPEEGWVYEADDMTTLSGRELAVEALRGALFARFNEELPYQTTVEIASWERKADQGVTIKANVLVAQKSQKGMIIGDKGSGVRSLRLKSEEHLRRVMGCSVDMELTVLVGKAKA